MTKSKKAYIEWDDNEVSSSSDSKNEEYANLALMASHHSDYEDEEVSNKICSYDNDVQRAIDELLNEWEILYKTVPAQKKKKSSLEENIDTMEKDFEVKKQKQNFTCKEHESLSFQIFQFKWVLERYEKEQIGLHGVLSQPRYSNDKSGLDHSKFDKPNSSKPIFIKANDQSTKEKVNKVNHVHHYPKKIFVKKKS